MAVRKDFMRHGEILQLLNTIISAGCVVTHLFVFLWRDGETYSIHNRVPLADGPCVAKLL